MPTAARTTVSLAFAISLGERDWNANIGGWNCSALAIPGARIDGIYESGTRVDFSWYEVLPDIRIIRWIRAGNEPKHITVTMVLTEELSTDTETRRWKKLAITLPVLATIGAALITAGSARLLSLPPTSKSERTASVPVISNSAPDAQGKTQPAAPTVKSMEPTGFWIGRWDNTYLAQFTITRTTVSGEFSVLYEREERVGSGLKTSLYTGRIDGNTLKIDSGRISMVLSERDGEAIAYGAFKTPRTAVLVRQRK